MSSSTNCHSSPPSLGSDRRKDLKTQRILRSQGELWTAPQISEMSGEFLYIYIYLLYMDIYIYIIIYGYIELYNYIYNDIIYIYIYYVNQSGHKIHTNHPLSTPRVMRRCARTSGPSRSANHQSSLTICIN